MKTLHTYGVVFGADPELFLSQEGEVIGAEKVIPKEGIILRDSEGQAYGSPIIIIDGVQAEFNPEANSCRESFSSNLKQCFVKLAETLKDKPGIKADFAQTVEVSKKEMATLEPSSQQFGCAPSKNAYEEVEISVKDASQYRYRSAGGHVHIGHGGSSTLQTLFATEPVEVIKVMDIVLGNTCVLLDRDAGNIERRKVYGKAGEFRSPKHGGIEYRTLSNFWLRSYQLMSFVLGTARFAVSIAVDKALREELVALVDMDDVRKAINTNDFDLAYKNFNLVKEFLSNLNTGTGYPNPFDSRYGAKGLRLKNFEVLVADGIEKYFPVDAMTYWLKHSTGMGWENFIDTLIPAVASQEAPVQDAAILQAVGGGSHHTSPAVAAYAGGGGGSGRPGAAGAGGVSYSTKPF